MREPLQNLDVGNSIFPVARSLDRSDLSQSTEGSNNDLPDGSKLLSEYCLCHSQCERGMLAGFRSGPRSGPGVLRSLQNEASQAGLDAARGVLIKSFNKALHAQRQTPQKEERQPGVCCDCLCDSWAGEKQASCWLGGYGSRGVAITRKKGHLSEGSARFTGMDDRLTVPAYPHDAHFPFENECNSF